MRLPQEEEALLRQQLIEFLKGGFAPVVILLTEFHVEKTGIVLDGLHFSAYTLLGHMQHRQKQLLQFMKDPQEHAQVWEDAHWPQEFEPKEKSAWLEAVEEFEQTLAEAIRVVENPATPLYKPQPNGKSIAWAAMALFHHNGYHIGQMKALGRQLGVW